MKICVARKLKVLELLRKERYLFSMFKTLVWMKVPLFSMKITIIFFINPDSVQDFFFNILSLLFLILPLPVTIVSPVLVYCCK